MKTCFIIMPITTPDAYLEFYKDDKDHFRHVLDHLFIPAIKGSSLDPMPPIARGSDVIHAEIIKNLETADLVLCDMSQLNPNVFFELGIRTALNKPVCLVLDDVSPSPPFDTTIINNHKYSSALDIWNLDGEIEKLKNHIEESLARSPLENTLWKIFGLTMRGEPAKKADSTAEQLSLLSLQVEGLRKQIESTYSLREPVAGFETSLVQQAISKLAIEKISEILTKEIGPGNFSFNHRLKDNAIRLLLNKSLSKAILLEIFRIAGAYGAKIQIGEVENVDSKAT